MITDRQPLVVDVSPAPFSERPVLRRLMELYLYDFSPMTGDDLNEHGEFGYYYFDNYWTEQNRHPFLIRAGGKLAGFVLVRLAAVLPQNDRSIAEFFVMQKYRRAGVGKQAAFEIFNRLPGRWEIRQIPQNAAGTAFWRAILTEYTHGSYHETYLNQDDWDGPAQWFDNSRLS